MVHIGISDHSLIYTVRKFTLPKSCESVNSFECLGVLIDEKLSWDLHVDKTWKKVGSSIAVMKKIKPFVPNSTLQTIYKAMIQPYFD